MTPESKNDDVGVLWSEIAGLLPKDLAPGEAKMLKGYYRVQVRLEDHQKVRATELMKSLQNVTGFMEFEDSHEPLFVAVEIAVRGSTNRTDKLKNIIKPLFRITH